MSEGSGSTPEVKAEVEDEVFKELEAAGVPTGLEAMYRATMERQKSQGDEVQSQPRKRGRPRLHPLPNNGNAPKKKYKTGTTDSDFVASPSPSAPVAQFGRSSRPRKQINYATIDEPEKEEEEEDMSLRVRTKKHDNEYESASTSHNKTPVVKRTYLPLGLTPAQPVNECDSYLEVLPKYNEELPDKDDRKFSSKVDTVEGVMTACGGFQHFVKMIDDKAMIKLFTLVSSKFRVESGNDEMELAQTLRHVWNKMTPEYRRNWEIAARKFAERNSLPMPASEFPMLSAKEMKDVNHQNGGVMCHCCKVPKSFHNLFDLAHHFSSAHGALHLFGCHFCKQSFQSAQQLRAHQDCPDFGAFVLKMALEGKPVDMKCVYLFLSCTDCGLWIPVRSRTATTRAWNYLSVVMENHSCSTLVPVLIHFADDSIETMKGARITLKIFPIAKCGITLDCTECKIERFESAEAIENHYRTVHPDSCKNCERCGFIAGTEYALRVHLMSHFHDALHLANYLRYSALFHPPDKLGGLPYIGHNKSNIAVGGIIYDFNISSSQSADDFVKVKENSTRRKLMNCVENAALWKEMEKDREKKGEEGNAGKHRRHQPGPNTSRVPRADMGYEGIDYSIIHPKPEEEKLRKELNSAIEKEGGSENLLEKGTILLKGEDAMEKIAQLGGASFEQTEIDGNDAFAQSVFNAYKFSVALPLSTCIDPLRSFLLVNRRYSYCEKCKTLFTCTYASHITKGPCDAEESDVRELFHPANSPARGISCVFPKCKSRHCSVVALRAHANLDHGLFVNFEADPAESFSDNSLIEILQLYAATRDREQRSRMARYTDTHLQMGFGGALKFKSTRFTTVPTADVTVMKPVAPRQKQLPNISAEVAAHQCQAGYVVTEDDFARCRYCGYYVRSPAGIQNHMRTMHSMLCRSCGLAFATAAHLKSHRERCIPYFGGNLHESERRFMDLYATCGICQLRVELSCAHSHLIRNHFEQVRYNVHTGEFFPRMVSVSLRKYALSGERIAPRLEQSRTLPNPLMNEDMEKALFCPEETNESVPGIHTKATCLGNFYLENGTVNYIISPMMDLRRTCYLCELEFPDMHTLDSHLKRHKETWNTCPFCFAPVNGHYDMQKHLISAHLKKNESGYTCQYCRVTYKQGAFAHVIYHCRRVPRCGLCGYDVFSADDLNRHLGEKHIDMLKRFQCSHCRIIFISVTEFTSHKCNVPARGGNIVTFHCDCSDQRFYYGTTQFFEHFQREHYKYPNWCVLCCKSYTLRTGAEDHRLVHMHTKEGPSRSLIIMQQELVDFVLQKTPAITIRPSKRVMANPAPVHKVQFKSVVTNKKQPPVNLVSNEVIELSDDDEPAVLAADEINGAGSADEQNDVDMESNDMPPPLEPNDDDVNNMIASVRVETSSADNAGGSGEPGYVEDGNDVELLVEPAPVSEEVRKTNVREIVDENADEDLAIVAEVENTAGLTSSLIAAASRIKQHPCPKCSCNFFTSKALDEHLYLMHRSDAGETTSNETFGIPVKTTSFICRNCCIVFQSAEMYQQHMSIHGSTSLTCKDCSGIAFNAAMLAQHAKSHESGTSFYGCGKCLYKFSTDAHLMMHLQATHNVQLYFFCKVCGFGSTDADTAFSHAIFARHDKSRLPPLQRLGVCQASLLNFEPRSADEWRNQSKLVECIVPSDCAHRSMLLSADPLVTCHDCHCTMSLAMYSSTQRPNVTYAFTPVEPQDQMSAQYACTSALSNKHQVLVKRHLNMIAHNNMIKSNMPVDQFPRQRARVLHPTATLMRNATPPTVLIAKPPHRQLAPSRLFSPQVVNLEDERPSSSPSPVPAASPMPANGVTVTATVLGPISRPPSSGPSSSSPSPAGSQASGSNGAAPSNGARSLAENCRVCKTPMITTAMVKKHDLHLQMSKKYFCDRCGHSETNEMDLMIHYFQVHVADSMKKNPALRLMSFDLRCPVSKCSSVTFTSLKLFREHVSEHISLLPYMSTACNTRFADKKSMEKHVASHTEFEEKNMMEGNCCPLCGTLDTYSISHTLNQTNQKCLISHSARHGLERFVACRACFEEFPDDRTHQKFKDHFVGTHLVLRSAMCCTSCGTIENSLPDFINHAVNEHLIYGLRRPHNPSSELTVRATRDFAEYLGLIGTT